MVWIVSYTPLTDRIEQDEWLCGIADGMEAM
jgi:hypothetical protein